MPEIINLEDKFNSWFHEHEGFATRSERFYDSLEQFNTKDALISNLLLWLKAAYLHGIKTAAQDSSDTLRDYATALAGLEPEMLTATEKYDDAAWVLNTYWDEILGKYNDD